VAKFTDAKNREWQFREITFADLAELKALGLDVEAVSADLGLLAGVFEDRRRLAELLWWFVAPAVAAAKVDGAEFHRGLTGDTLYAATVAIRDSVIGFFHYPPAVKADMIRRLTEAETTAWAAQVGSPSAGPSSPPSPASTTAP
jgi:hypothetical protein